MLVLLQLWLEQAMLLLTKFVQRGMLERVGESRYRLARTSPLSTLASSM